MPTYASHMPELNWACGWVCSRLVWFGGCQDAHPRVFTPVPVFISCSSNMTHISTCVDSTLIGQEVDPTILSCFQNRTFFNMLFYMRYSQTWAIFLSSADVLWDFEPPFRKSNLSSWLDYRWKRTTIVPLFLFFFIHTTVLWSEMRCYYAPDHYAPDCLKRPLVTMSLDSIRPLITTSLIYFCLWSLRPLYSMSPVWNVPGRFPFLFIMSLDQNLPVVTISLICLFGSWYISDGSRPIFLVSPASTLFVGVRNEMSKLSYAFSLRFGCCPNSWMSI